MQNTIHIAFKLGREDSLWAAPHFGDYDPYKVKHEVTDEQAEGRTHPVFFNVQETWEVWAKAIEKLHPRQALIKRPARTLLGKFHLDEKTVKIKTLTMKANLCTQEMLEGVKERYAELLLRPIETIANAPNIPATPPPMTRRERIL